MPYCNLHKNNANIYCICQYIEEPTRRNIEVWHIPHGINIHYAPKNSYNYYMLYERLSPARNSLFHAASIFIAENDFQVGITQQLLAHLTKGCQHLFKGASSTALLQRNGLSPLLALLLTSIPHALLTSHTLLPGPLYENCHPETSEHFYCRNRLLGTITISSTQRTSPKGASTMTRVP